MRQVAREIPACASGTRGLLDRCARSMGVHAGMHDAWIVPWPNLCAEGDIACASHQAAAWRGVQVEP